MRQRERRVQSLCPWDLDQITYKGMCSHNPLTKDIRFAIRLCSAGARNRVNCASVSHANHRFRMRQGQDRGHQRIADCPGSKIDWVFIIPPSAHTGTLSAFGGDGEKEVSPSLACFEPSSLSVAAPRRPCSWTHFPPPRRCLLPDLACNEVGG